VVVINSESYAVSIFIAGDHERAKQICREWCFNIGGCVTVTPTTYIYTGGEESGVIVGFINYPRFPTTPDDLLTKARQLADGLMHGLCQHSYSIQTPETTYWHSRRPE
jgi:hypothetical protein